MGNTVEYWQERATKNGVEILRLRERIAELEAEKVYDPAFIKATAEAHDRIKAKYTALKEKLDRVRGLQRYTVTTDSYVTDNPEGKWIRANELQSALGDEDE